MSLYLLSQVINHCRRMRSGSQMLDLQAILHVQELGHVDLGPHLISENVLLSPEVNLNMNHLSPQTDKASGDKLINKQVRLALISRAV